VNKSAMHKKYQIILQILLTEQADATNHEAKCFCSFQMLFF